MIPTRNVCSFLRTSGWIRRDCATLSSYKINKFPTTGVTVLDVGKFNFQKEKKTKERDTFVFDFLHRIVVSTERSILTFEKKDGTSGEICDRKCEIKHFSNTDGSLRVIHV